MSSIKDISATADDYRITINSLYIRKRIENSFQNSIHNFCSSDFDSIDGSEFQSLTDFYDTDTDIEICVDGSNTLLVLLTELWLEEHLCR